MDKFDRQLQKDLRAHAPQMSTSGKRKFEAALPHKKKHYKGLVIAVFALVLFVLPNINASVAQHLYDLPVVGEIFKVTSIYHYQDDNTDVNIPQVKKHSQSVTYINKSVKEWTTQALSEFKKAVGNAKNASLKIDYKVVTNNKYWFTLKVESLTTAADSDRKVYYYNIDKATGKTVTIKDLFKQGYDYKKVINSSVLKVINSDTKGQYFKEGDDLVTPFKTIDQNTQFYINNKHQLVMVFQQGDIGPMSSGTPEFTISTKTVMKGLKEHGKKIIY